MIRVLHVFGALNMGGAETMIMNLYRHVDRDQVQFDFVIHTTEHCAYSDEIVGLGGRIYSIEPFNIKNSISYQNQWKSFFNSHKEYKIVHGHMRSTASIYLHVAKKMGMYTIAHSHNMSSGNGLSAVVKNFLQLPLRYIADEYMACSLCAGKWLFGKKIIFSNRFYILNNAIEIDKFLYNPVIRMKKRKELFINDVIVFGHIGRFEAQKNHSFLIDVFEAYYEKHKNCILFLIGEGPKKNEMQDIVHKKGLDDVVIFFGKRNDVHELMQVMDVFLFPSLYEGLGIVAIEAQTAGLFTICSNKVPKEVAITNLINFLPIDHIASWVETIENNEFSFRENTKELIRKAGYDINDTSKWLQEHYQSICDTKMRDRIGK